MNDPIRVPICAKCGRMMRCKKNEFPVKDVPSGLNIPLVVWSGDMYECPKCGAQVVVGFGKGITGEAAAFYATEAMEFTR